MALFSRGIEAVLGVDISPTSVKVLELGPKGSDRRVEAYAVVPLPEGAVAEDKTITNADVVGETLEKALRKSGTKLKNAATAVSGSAVITRVIQMPAGLGDRDMESQVPVEADQYIPFSIDEVHMDFEVLGPYAEDEEKVDVLLAACRSDTVENKMSALEMAGLVAKVVDVEALALENVVNMMTEEEYGEEQAPVTAVADIGGGTTMFSVLENSRVVFSREEAFGGNQLTEKIQQTFSMSYQEADMAKRQGGLPDNYESDVLDPFRKELAQQLGRTIQFFYSSSHISSIDRLLLAGGSAAIPELAEVMGQEVAVPTTVADPFANMSLASRVPASQLQKDAPSLMLCCGLALRSFD